MRVRMRWTMNDKTAEKNGRAKEDIVQHTFNIVFMYNIMICFLSLFLLLLLLHFCFLSIVSSLQACVRAIFIPPLCLHGLALLSHSLLQSV